MEKTIFEIKKMDCPSEENLIRMKLDGISSIKYLNFDIPNRKLIIFHSGQICQKAAIVKKLLKGTYNHFSWFLPEKLGPLTAFFLKFLFSGVKFEKDQADVFKQLPEDAIIVFVSKHKSHMERLFFYGRRQSSGIPAPEIGIGYRVFAMQPLIRLFRIMAAHIDHWVRNLKFLDPFAGGYVQQALEEGRSAIVPLVNTGGYRLSKREVTDPLQFFLEMQTNSTRPICLVPYLFFYGSHTRSAATRPSTRSTGVDPKPGILYRLVLLFTAPERIFVEISEPLNLATTIERPQNARFSAEALTLNLRHQLLDQITRHRQSITGPILKPIEEIRQQILTTNRIRTFMKTWADRRKLTMFQVQQEAVKYVDEIAARPSPFLISVAAGIVKWLLSNLFEGTSVNVEGLKKMRQASRKGPLIIMPC